MEGRGQGMHRVAAPGLWATLHSYRTPNLRSIADQNRTAVDWEDIRVFTALARHGSLSAAARALSITHATVARRISSLEEALGSKLVERRPDGYVLTSAGNRVLKAASDMETAAARL